MEFKVGDRIITKEGLHGVIKFIQNGIATIQLDSGKIVYKYLNTINSK